MGERHSEFTRDTDDWYVEPASCVRALLERCRFDGGIHDPCCGVGTIVRTAHAAGLQASGADLIDRANSAYEVRDFLTDNRRYPNIVTNPPFRIAANIVEHALERSAGRVAIVAQAKFLFSQARHPLFSRVEMERVLVFSRRPSMPPGKMLADLGESCRGGGSIDFVWCIWNVAKVAPGCAPGCAVEWVI